MFVSDTSRGHDEGTRGAHLGTLPSVAGHTGPLKGATDDDLPLTPEREIMALSSAIAAAQARILELMATKADQITGGDDPANWLAWAAGMKPATARRYVRLAERLTELPQIKEAFAGGELSFEKTETIARVAVPETESQLVAWAQNGLCSQLASITSGLRRAKVSVLGAAAAQRDQYLDYHYTDEGSFRLRTQMPAEKGALVAQALEAAEAQLWQEEKTFTDQDADESLVCSRVDSARGDSGSRRADALVAFAETFLAHGLSDGPASDRFQVMVHVDQAALAGDHEATCELEDGTGLSIETARRISCDCSIVELLEKDGVPLKLGRSRRTISRGLRRALKARDRHCVFPGCTNTRRTQGHHVEHWASGRGLTDLENLCLLCPRHHRLMHEGRYTMTFDGKVATFYRPDGTQVERVPTYTTISEVELAEWSSAAAVDPDHWSHCIDPCNYSDAISFLCESDPEVMATETAELERLPLASASVS